MVEQDWHDETEPTRMWRFVRPSATPRKARLFCLACARRALGPALPSAVGVLLTLVEEVAEGADMTDAFYEAKGALGVVMQSLPANDPRRRAAMAALHAAERDLLSPTAASYVVHEAAGSKPDPDAEYAVQADLLRDLFGNPFRPVTVDPSWLTSTVLALAEGIAQERAFDRMPILGDALEDAECDSQAILEHCRLPGAHVWGCWTIDLLLGRA